MGNGITPTAAIARLKVVMIDVTETVLSGGSARFSNTLGALFVPDSPPRRAV
jgi:hypothetical protein